MKLTEQDKKNIIAMYAGGGVSQVKLAQKYGVSRKAIQKVLAQGSTEYAQKVAEVKKTAEEKAFKSLDEFIKAKVSTVTGLMGRLLDVPDTLIEKSSLYERMGAIKTLRDVFTTGSEGQSEKAALDELCDAIKTVSPAEEVNE